MPGGVRVGDDEITFAGETRLLAGGPGRASPSTGRGKQVLVLDGKEIDLDRSQGDIGLFVPDAGYPFGDIPDWLIRQRARRPAGPE